MAPETWSARLRAATIFRYPREVHARTLGQPGVTLPSTVDDREERQVPSHRHPGLRLPHRRNAVGRTFSLDRRIRSLCTRPFKRCPAGAREARTSSPSLRTVRRRCSSARWCRGLVARADRWMCWAGEKWMSLARPACRPVAPSHLPVSRRASSATSRRPYRRRFEGTRAQSGSSASMSRLVAAAIRRAGRARRSAARDRHRS